MNGIIELDINLLWFIVVRIIMLMFLFFLSDILMFFTLFDIVDINGDFFSNLFLNIFFNS